MAIVNPQPVMYDRGQSGTATVTVSSASDISGWLVRAQVRDYNGGPVLSTKTVGSGITSSYAGGVQTWVISFSTTDTNIDAGAHVWDFWRIDSGFEYQIFEDSAFVIRDTATLGSPTLTNPSEYFAHAMLGATPTSALALQMTQILGAAEQRIKRYCGRQFTYAERTEYPIANWEAPLMLTETPVRSITSLYLDWGAAAGQSSDPWPASTLLTLGTDYFLDRDRVTDNYSDTGFVYRIGGGWWFGGGFSGGGSVRGGWGGGWNRDTGRLSFQKVPVHGAIKCVYIGGYSIIPYDLKQVVWNTATIMRGFAPTGRMVDSWSGEGLSLSYGGRMEDAINHYLSNENILESYRSGMSRIG